MRRNCNLELSLSPSSSSGPSVSQDYNAAVQQLPTSGHSSPSTLLTKSRVSEESRRQPQQLTVFYDGKVVSCDVTEIQARAIILLASQERAKKTTRPVSEPSSPLLQKQLYSQTALSMKRSLQRFLQKRKNRVQATSPYHR